MKAGFAKFMKSFTAIICAIIWATVLPLQMAFAAYDYIPKAWWGSYDSDANSRYLLVLSSKETNIVFRGFLTGYGEIAAYNPSSIYFHPVTGVYKENFTVKFENYSVYNATTKKYQPVDGDAIFVANANTQNSNIKVLNLIGSDYSDPSHVYTFKMFA